MRRSPPRFSYDWSQFDKSCRRSWSAARTGRAENKEDLQRAEQLEKKAADLVAPSRTLVGMLTRVRVVLASMVQQSTLVLHLKRGHQKRHRRRLRRIRSVIWLIRCHRWVCDRLTALQLALLHGRRRSDERPALAVYRKIATPSRPQVTMSSATDNLLRLAQPVPRRVGFWLAKCVLGAILALVLMVFGPWFAWSFETAHLHYIWPTSLALLAATVAMPVVRQFNHGDSICTEAPIVWCATLTWYLAILYLFTYWAIDWSFLWCVTILVGLGLLSRLISRAWESYREPWRKRHNRAVVDRVWEEATRHNRRPSDHLLSQHHLRVLEARYRQLLERRLANGDEPQLAEFQRAADSLIEYLRLPATETQLPETSRQRLLMRTLVESIAVSLFFGQGGAADQADQANRLDRWLGLLRETESGLSDEDPIVADLLSTLTEMERAEPLQAASGATPLSTTAEKQYCGTCLGIADRARKSSVKIAETDLPVVCSRLWIALTRRIRRQARLDIWRTMTGQECEGDPVLQGRLNGHGRAEMMTLDERFDVSSCLALRVLPELYKDWRERVPNGWDTGLEKRAAYWHQLHDRMEGRLGERDSQRNGGVSPELLEQTKGCYSWPYSLTWEPHCTRRARSIRFVLLLLLAALPLMAANPRLPFYPRWNTVDHVGDPRLWCDYTSREIGAGAFSGELIGLGTDEGLTVVNTDSRIPRESVTDRPVVDLAAGPAKGSFLVLDEEPVIDFVPHGLTSSGVRPWLERPADPLWQGVSVGSRHPRVLAAADDETGQTLAVESWGIGRCQDRSWTWRNLADLTDAVITDDVIWTGTTTNNRSRLVALDRRTLSEIDGTMVALPAVRHFDVEPHTGRVSAIDGSEQLWLYGNGPAGWQGPYLAGATDGVALRTAEDVRVARREGRMTLLGTSYGLFVHDGVARRIGPVIIDASVVDILPVGSDAKAASCRALIRTTDGLHRLGWPTHGRQPPATASVYKGNVLSADLSNSTV